MFFIQMLLYFQGVISQYIHGKLKISYIENAFNTKGRVSLVHRCDRVPDWELWLAAAQRHEKVSYRMSLAQEKTTIQILKYSFFWMCNTFTLSQSQMIKRWGTVCSAFSLQEESQALMKLLCIFFTQQMLGHGQEKAKVSAPRAIHSVEQRQAIPIQIHI